MFPDLYYQSSFEAVGWGATAASVLDVLDWETRTPVGRDPPQTWPSFRHANERRSPGICVFPTEAPPFSQTYPAVKKLYQRCCQTGPVLLGLRSRTHETA